MTASQRLLDLDLLAYISTTRAFLPLLKRHSGGRVVNIGSYGGYTPVPGWVSYNAVKAAVDNMTRAWNYETMRAYGIKMTVVRPGWVATAGIGPKILSAMERFDDEEVDLKAGRAASGFDSLGNVLRVDEGMDGSIMRRYTSMMEKWKTVVRTNTVLGTPPEHVAKTVMDAFMSSLPLSLFISLYSLRQLNYTTHRPTLGSNLSIPSPGMPCSRRWSETSSPSRFMSGGLLRR